MNIILKYIKKRIFESKKKKLTRFMVLYYFANAAFIASSTCIACWYNTCA